MRKTDARRKASGALLRLRGGPCGARSSGPSATRMSLGKTTFRKGRACGLCFFYCTRFRARESLQGCHGEDVKQRRTVRAERGRAKAVCKDCQREARGLPVRRGSPLAAAGKGLFRRRFGKMRWQGRVALSPSYFFFFFCSRRHCQGGVGSLSCQRPRRSLRAMASSSFQVLQMSLVQK